LKINKLVVTGCSWCWGPYDYCGGERTRKSDYLSHLDRDNDLLFTRKDAPNYSFGAVLAKKLDVEFVNLATAGASNMSQLFKLWSHEVIKQNNLSNTLVIHGLTEPSRTLVCKNGELANIKPDMLTLDAEFKKLYFTKYYTEEHRVQETFLILDYLNGYLKNQNSKLLVFNSFSFRRKPHWNTVYPLRDYVYPNFHTWAEYINSYDDEIDIHKKLTHPNKNDHEIFANDLYTYLND